MHRYLIIYFFVVVWNEIHVSLIGTVVYNVNLQDGLIGLLSITSLLQIRVDHTLRGRLDKRGTKNRIIIRKGPVIILHISATV